MNRDNAVAEEVCANCTPFGHSSHAMMSGSASASARWIWLQPPKFGSYTKAGSTCAIIRSPESPAGR